MDIVGSIWGFVLYISMGRGRWTAHRKTVLLTGATTTVGSETARQLAMEGARLALVASKMEDLERLALECRELGSSKVITYTFDLTNGVSAEMAIQKVAKDFGGRIDVVIVHGEKFSQGCFFEEIQKPGEIEQMLKENVLTCMLTLHHALKHVPKTCDSRIVILSSTSGMVASPYRTVASVRT
jgi:NADP-dependent 3-hydroxy acid dehydrogenase YdfG